MKVSLPLLLALLLPRWFCHVDDDNYVNVRALLRLLASYPHTQDVYIGKPSLDRPIQATERVSENQMVSVPPPPTRLSRAGRRPEVSLPPGPRVSLSPAFPPAAPCPLLVCHWGGWLLHQPWPGPEDEPMGQVSALGTQVRLPSVLKSPHCGPWLPLVDLSSGCPNLTCTGRLSHVPHHWSPPAYEAQGLV